MGSHEIGGWLAPNLCFWLFTILALTAAAAAVFAGSIVRAAYSLFFTLLAMAGFYVLLGSGFLAIAQVIIYVGGILVLLMFGVLLTDRPLQTSSGKKYGYLLGASAAAALLLNVLVRIIMQTKWQVAGKLPEPSESLRELGSLLLADYLLPFELAGVTLLVCLVGAAYLVRRREA